MHSIVERDENSGSSKSSREQSPAAATETWSDRLRSGTNFAMPSLSPPHSATHQQLDHFCFFKSVDCVILGELLAGDLQVAGIWAVCRQGVSNT